MGVLFPREEFRARGFHTLGMAKLQVIIQLLHSQAQLPFRAHQTDACFDLRASENLTIGQGQTGLVPLGWSMQLEEGWEAIVRGRSGLASQGIVAHLGTIDHLYRQEVKVIIHNFSGSDFVVQTGDRIAQLTFAPVYPVDLKQGEVELTERGGFGSTGRR
ncbi:MAG: dUTP diphosphatase [Vulcanimicrobiota bacterium]